MSGNLDTFLEDNNSVNDESDNDSAGASAAASTETQTSTEAANTTETTKTDVSKVENAETTTAKNDYENLPPWAKAALKDERDKRQALETQVREFQSKQQSTQQQQKQEEPPDLFENPEARLEYERQMSEERRFNDKVALSASIVSSMPEYKNDYIQMTDAFKEAVKSNPILERQFIAHPNPALFAYHEGKRFLAMQEIGDPVSFREKIRAEERERILKELEQDQSKNAEAEANAALERKKLNASLTGVRSAGADSKSAKNDEEADPFNQLFDAKTRRIKK